jgi:hypothetical protein
MSAEEDAKRLFNKHLDWFVNGDILWNILNAIDTLTVDWEEFLSDLRRCPELASIKMGISSLCALQYVLLIDDVPAKVIRKLVKVNPDALNACEAHHGWNTLQWLQWANQTETSPEILCILLERRPEFAIQEKAEEKLAPVYHYMRHNPLSDQVKAILETSNEAVALVLAFHFSGEEPIPIPPKLFKFALNRAYKLEKSGHSIFDLELRYRYSMGDGGTFTLVEKLFQHLNAMNSKLLHRYLKAFVVGRRTYLSHDGGRKDCLSRVVDKNSLTCCVLYLLAKLEPTAVQDTGSGGRNITYNFDRGEFWQKYLEACRDDVTKPTNRGSLPLYAAIRICHQWNPVIRDIVKEDVHVLETLDVKHRIPPFMVAAASIGNRYNFQDLGDSYTSWHDYKNINTVNTTYELLRANPSTICPPKSTITPRNVAPSVDKKRAIISSNKSKEVILPTGRHGMIIQGAPAKISRMTSDSPMRGIDCLGMLVDKLSLPDGTEYRGINARQLSKALGASSDVAGRVLYLKNPGALDLAKKSTTKLPLPVGNLGLTFIGEPAVIHEVAETSPLAGKVWPGQLVDTIVLTDGTEYYDLGGLEAMHILEESADSKGRFLLVTNFDEDVTMPDEVVVELPASHLGVTFEGSPPVITEIAEDSPLKDELMVGLAVDTVTLADGSKHMEFATSSLVKMLKDTDDMVDRAVVLRNPSTMKFTSKPAVVEVTLPRGELGESLASLQIRDMLFFSSSGIRVRVLSAMLGVVFAGTPPKVTNFLEGSPMVGKIFIGMVVDVLMLDDGTMLSGLNAKELVEVLKESDETDGRTMLLKNNPSCTRNNKLSAKQILPPDEKKVELPPGYLGVSLKGKVGKSTKIHDDFPVKGSFRVGMVIDTLILPNGSTYSGLTAKELGVVLRGSADLKGRMAILKNPETVTLSDRKMMENDAEHAFFEADDVGEVSQRG